MIIGFLGIAVLTSFVASGIWMLTGGTFLMAVLIYILTGQLVVAACLARIYFGNKNT